jgi:uncharacterized membrane protein YeaQ/YmgE (transglycosylase-associated protein family)
MTILGFLVLLLIAAICGAIAQAIVGYSVGGCLLSSVVGIIGALLGYWLAGALALPLVFTINIQGQPFPVIWSIIGAVLFVGVVAFLTRGRYE